jgi:glycerol-3-phosphate dehydrogenase
LPLPGARAADVAALRDEVNGIAEILSIPSASVAHLIRTFGARALAVLELADREPELRAVVAPETGAIAAEVVFAVRDELAQDLEDVLLRRTMVGLGREVGIGADRRMAEVAVRHLGWTAAHAEAEVAAYRAHVERLTPLALHRFD